MEYVEEERCGVGKKEGGGYRRVVLESGSGGKGETELGVDGIGEGRMGVGKALG